MVLWLYTCNNTAGTEAYGAQDRGGDGHGRGHEGETNTCTDGSARVGSGPLGDLVS